MHQAKCPGCNAVTHIGGSNHLAPFCSKRCQDLDFGAWANEKYKLPEQKLSDNPLAENIYSDIIKDSNSEYGE
jgi:uncharacterized protein